MRIESKCRFRVFAEKPTMMSLDGLAFGRSHASPFASIFAHRHRLVFLVSFRTSIRPSSKRIRLQACQAAAATRRSVGKSMDSVP